MAFVAYISTTPGSGLQSRIRVLERFILIGLCSPVLRTPCHRQIHQAAASPCASRKGEHDNETFQTTQRHRYVVNKGYAGRIADVSMAWEPGLSISRILGNDADSLGNSRQQLHRIRSRIPHLEQGFYCNCHGRTSTRCSKAGISVSHVVCHRPRANYVLASLVHLYVQSNAQELLHRCATIETLNHSMELDSPFLEERD
ncbi:hypothetical protein J3F84DRAFT_297662 [Trichoderma pleuroticola]